MQPHKAHTVLNSSVQVRKITKQTIYHIYILFPSFTLSLSFLHYNQLKMSCYLCLFTSKKTKRYKTENKSSAALCRQKLLRTNRHNSTHNSQRVPILFHIIYSLHTHTHREHGLPWIYKMSMNMI